jgi:hypothetical protein
MPDLKSFKSVLASYAPYRGAPYAMYYMGSLAVIPLLSQPIVEEAVKIINCYYYYYYYHYYYMGSLR